MLDSKEQKDELAKRICMKIGQQTKEDHRLQVNDIEVF